MPTSPRTSTPTTTSTGSATRVWIDQDDEPVTVAHASSVEHIERHRARLAKSAADRIDTGAQLWTARTEIYPDLTFLPRVEQDLDALQPVFVPSVRNRLIEIQEAVRGWDPAAGVGPHWQSKIPPEHEVRKRLCHFEDLDGELRLFDPHARFPPGRDMRLHFRLVEGDRSARIAHIGRKLGI